MWIKSHPVLPSLDLERTIQFYQQKLGFTLKHQQEEIAVLSKDDIELHFWKCDDESLPASSGCRIQVTEIDALFEQWQEQGFVASDVKMGVLEWGKIFPLGDVDGNLIWVFEGVPPWSQ